MKTQEIKTRILYIEDDEVIASGLVYALESEGYDVTHLCTVADALTAFDGGGGAFALAILDLSLPDGTGFDIISRIRAAGDMPVIFATAADDEGNTVKGLELGADDYITKPLRVRELTARVKAVLRRHGSSGDRNTVQDVLTLGDIKIFPEKVKVFRGGETGEEIFLSALEYRLLLLFASNKGRTLTRNQILELLWDEAGNFVNDNTLTVYIKRLRERLTDDPQMPQLIQTVRGIGYRTEG